MVGGVVLVVGVLEGLEVILLLALILQMVGAHHRNLILPEGLVGVLRFPLVRGMEQLVDQQVTEVLLPQALQLLTE